MIENSARREVRDKKTVPSADIPRAQAAALNSLEGVSELAGVPTIAANSRAIRPRRKCVLVFNSVYLHVGAFDRTHARFSEGIRFYRVKLEQTEANRINSGRFRAVLKSSLLSRSICKRKDERGMIPRRDRFGRSRFTAKTTAREAGAAERSKKRSQKCGRDVTSGGFEDTPCLHAEIRRLARVFQPPSFVSPGPCHRSLARAAVIS